MGGGCALAVGKSYPPRAKPTVCDAGDMFNFDMDTSFVDLIGFGSPPINYSG